MQRAAIILIVIAVLVIAGGYWFATRTVEQVPPEPNVAERSTLRSTTSGDVIGFIDDHGARGWMGIPYAQPPVGNLRWRAPQPVIASTAPIEALAAGNVCPQKPSLLAGADMSSPVTGSEDCLYLNIWSPPNARELPVMLWIHGGGNTIGHGGSYNGATLAATHGLVIVTINYRMGMFGWFSHPALKNGDPADDSGNYGTLDSIEALRWVQANIAQFGGDPENVTVFGESAGAADTLAVMASPLAQGLFHRAIVQSGGFNPASMTAVGSYIEDGGDENSGPEIVNKLLIADGKVTDRAAAKNLQEDMGNANLRAYLHEKTPADFYGLFEGGGFGMIATPDLFGDGHVLPDLSAAEIFSSLDNHNPVPVILGTNRDEPTLFMTRDPRYVDTYFGVFNRLKDEAAYRRTVHYGASAWKARGVDELALAMTAAGNPRVFAYRFDWDEEPSILGFDLSVALGAGHALEIPFVFGDFEGGLGISYVYPGDDNQAALSKSMMSYWAEFAYNGHPRQGRDGKETLWQPWGTEGQTAILLDTPGDAGIRMSDIVVTNATVMAELAADTSFADQRERCALYVRNFYRGDAFDRAEYDSLGEAGCREYPPEGFSRF